MTRTTLVLDEQRLVELKRLAAEQRQTLSSLVDQFLREGLQRAKSAKRRKAYRPLPGYDMGEFAADIANRDQLYDLMEEK